MMESETGILSEDPGKDVSMRRKARASAPAMCHEDGVQEEIGNRKFDLRSCIQQPRRGNEKQRLAIDGLHGKRARRGESDRPFNCKLAKRATAAH